MSRPTIASASLLAVALFGGCAKEQPPPATTSQSSTSGTGTMGMMGAESSCPMQVPGTAVLMGDASDGMSMTFTTTTGDVSDVRNRVRAMAEQMNARSSRGAMMMGDAGTNMMMGQGMGGGQTMMRKGDAGSGMMMGQGGMGMMGGAEGGGSHMMMRVRASVEDVPGGARLRVSPVDGSRLEEMKQHIYQQEQMMNEQHRCLSHATN